MAKANNFHAMMTTNKEFFTQACRWKDNGSVSTAAQWWAAFQEVIVRELFYNSSCRVPGLGYFVIKQEDGHFQKQKKPNGREVSYFVPGRITPVFRPEDDFINDVNMQGVTKQYRKRVKAGALTERDYIRQIRADSLAANACISEIIEQRKEEAKKEFQQLLAAKREQKEKANAKLLMQQPGPRAVVQMTLAGEYINTFDSMRTAAEKTGVEVTGISRCCSPDHSQKTAGGYKWKYAELVERGSVDELSE